ncbi:MAG: CapA family protein [Gemmatimonadetes bacterium]|nr:CapA family protein [Gemmatimonadota bacterium]NIR77049.1 CapA family protein [Gemmatimonadota bacterium]NIT85569.1 CapA family protein [Gemmatimonadota bacterium]NIU29401.1 CapA family protein [Gemmatimonadota bacterium]NIU34466.1 CapA family protein [Gemmatimonadota bacterium]
MNDATKAASGKLRRIAVSWLILSLLVPVTPARAQEVQGAEGRYLEASGDITMALAGDAIITRRMSIFDEPDFLSMVDVVRESTVSIVNLEMLFHDYGPEILPATSSGGAYMTADPGLAHELSWMGFDMVALANNHSFDWGIGGIESTRAAIAAAGIEGAGTGANLALARAPAYLQTRGGRVALISVASTFSPQSRAGSQRKHIRGRPGLNPLRHTTTYEVPPEDFAAVRRMKDALGVRRGEEADAVEFLGATFRRSDRAAVVTRPHEGDLAEILQEVRNARRQADWVVVTSHSHEGAESRFVPARFVVEFARAVVDAGADVFFGHGPHVLRGVEIYQGRPIFYSLSNFIFQNETLDFQPGDNYRAWNLPADALVADFHDRRAEEGRDWLADQPNWESVIASPIFRDGALQEVVLHPIDLGYGLERSQIGRPMLARGALARKIIERMQELSEPFGTRIELDGEVGRIRVGRGARSSSRR